MNIGAVAKLTGLSAKSIRLYEEKGIITSPCRSDAGYREYSDSHIQQLNLVSRAKHAGFSLQECKEFALLARDPNRQSRAVKAYAKDKLDEVERKIAELNAIKLQLEQWLVICPGDDHSACPIIDELTKKSQ